MVGDPGSAAKGKDNVFKADLVHLKWREILKPVTAAYLFTVRCNCVGRHCCCRFASIKRETSDKSLNMCVGSHEFHYRCPEAHCPFHMMSITIDYLGWNYINLAFFF